MEIAKVKNTSNIFFFLRHPIHNVESFVIQLVNTSSIFNRDIQFQNSNPPTQLSNNTFSKKKKNYQIIYKKEEGKKRTLRYHSMNI